MDKDGWNSLAVGTFVDLPDSGMKVKTMPICHGLPAKIEGEDKPCLPSTAFLLSTSKADASMIYLSDVGPFTPKRVHVKSDSTDVDVCIPKYNDFTSNDTPLPEVCKEGEGCIDACEPEAVVELDNPITEDKFKSEALNKVLDEYRKTMFNLWRLAADEICGDRLRAVFMECAYDNTEKPIVFGHLQPSAYFDEIIMLGRMVEAKCPGKKLDKLTFVITHIKPYHDAMYLKKKNVDGETVTVESLVAKQFTQLYNEKCTAESTCHGVKFLIPEQGTVVSF